MSGLLRAAGEIFLFCWLVLGAGAILRSTARAAFGPSAVSARAVRGGTVKALRSPGTRAIASAGRTAGRSAVIAAAHPGSRTYRAQAKADAYRVWETAKSTDWLEQRRHDRVNGTATAVRLGLRARLGKLIPFRPDPPDPASGGSASGKPATPDPPQPSITVPPAIAAPAPGRPAPAQPQQASAPTVNGGTTVAGSSTAPAEQLNEAVNAIYAHAASGNFIAKQEAVRAAHAAAGRFAGMCQMLARTMSEPGSNYGPEVTEPIATAGTNFQAGAMSLSEADASLETLGNMTLRESAGSPRQTPHHQNELSESGRH